MRFIVPVLACLLAIPAYAGDDHHHDDHHHEHKHDHGHDDHHHAEDERDRHLEVPTPATKAEAIKMLKEHSATMSKGWEEKDLDTIHVESYFLEAAITRLEEEAANASDDAKLATLSDLQTLVFKVHHASEDGKKDVIAKEFAQLSALITQVIDAK